MEKCKNCNCHIYESTGRRKAAETLKNLDKKYENIVNDLCVNCLKKETKNHLKKAILSKIPRMMRK